MVEERDIVWVAVPFSAGIAAGVFTINYIGDGIIAASVAVLPAVICMSLLVVADTGQRGWRALAVATLLSVGFAAAWSQALGGGSAGWSLPAATRACRWLRGLIDNIPFRNPETGSLLSALLTGDRTGLSRETIGYFRKSGASHLLALSGLHLGVIYLALSRIMGALGRSPVASSVKCLTTIGAAAFYTMMVGAGPSIVRAFLFITIREIAKVADERTPSPENTLMAALTIQLAINPSSITGAGFQMSYLAMFGIIYLLPRLQPVYYQIISDFENKTGETAQTANKRKKGLMERIWDSMALSVSCQIFTTPVAWIRFHSLPGHFLVTNLLALPLTTMLIVTALVTIVLSALHWCPTWMVVLCESFAQALTGILKIISCM